ncbi:hypothetical protein OOK27_13500 [Streptomyces canus]|uniref:hypothetical protein n=1 Tax=Streptomyces canus TaxID=58343 RepID=UPI00224F39AF|nr:hypothetical protein [Streptomyces canus]MCX5255143.1 hypothetical protein [Streptomyces canus]
MTFPVLIALALAVVLPRLPELLSAPGIPTPVIRRLRRGGRAVARAYLAFVAAGIILLLVWRYTKPFAWTAPLLVACGLILGQTSAAAPAAARRRRLWDRALPVAGAALFLMRVVALAAGQLGRQDAERDAERVVQRVAVLVHSTEQLSITGPPGLVITLVVPAGTTVDIALPHQLPCGHGLVAIPRLRHPRLGTGDGHRPGLSRAAE